MRLLDRETAGSQLAQTLSQYSGSDTVVLALPRGGVVIGAEIAKKLRAPLDLILVCKLVHPAFPEYAIGALAEGMSAIYGRSATERLDDELRETTEQNARRLIAWRRKQYFDFADNYRHPTLRDKVVVIADDGIATGLTMQAAVLAVRTQQARAIIVAAPIASPEGITRLGSGIDGLATLLDPDGFLGAVGLHYVRFSQIDDKTVMKLLKGSQHHATARHVTAIHP